MKYARSSRKERLLITCVLLLSLLTLTLNPAIAAEEMRREETVIMSLSHPSVDPTNFNPYIPDVAFGGNGMGLLCYEAFFYLNFFTGETTPWLATSYEYSDNYTKFTLHLREGVTWSDGAPFTAEDINFTFNMLKEHPEFPFRGWVDGADNMTVIDQYTVVFNLPEPDKRYWKNFVCGVRGFAFEPIMPKHIWSQVEDVASFTNNPPIGTGPYTLVSSTSDAVIWKLNENYWNKDAMPKPKYVVYKWYGQTGGLDERAMMALMKHEVDYFRGGTKEQLEMMRGVTPTIHGWSDVPPYFLPSFCPWVISVNLDMYPLNYSEVRWAISYAIDRQKLVDVALPATGYIAKTFWSPIYYGVLGKFIPWDLLAKWNFSEYNPQKSIELLEGLGFTRGSDGIFVTPNGTRLSFLYHSWDGQSDRMIQPMIVDMLKEVGIELEVKFIQGPQYWPMRAQGDYEFFRDFECGATTDPYDGWVHFSNENMEPRGVRGGLNRWRWNNTEITELISRMAELDIKEDEEEYIEINRKIWEIWLPELPMIPLIFFQGSAICYDTYYWTNWPNATNPSSPNNWLPVSKFMFHQLKPNRPPDPVTATVTDVAETSLTLSWEPSEHSYFQEYQIYQSESLGVLGAKIGTIGDRSTTSLEVSDLEPGKTYYFTVRVVNSEGLFSDSEQVASETKAIVIPFWQEPWFLATVAVSIIAIIVIAVILKRK